MKLEKTNLSFSVWWKTRAKFGLVVEFFLGNEKMKKTSVSRFQTRKITYFYENEKRKIKTYLVDTDEGPRADTDIEKLAKLKPVFASDGLVTAGNSSQTSDGAAFVLMMSEQMMKELGLQ